MSSPKRPKGGMTLWKGRVPAPPAHTTMTIAIYCQRILWFLGLAVAVASGTAVAQVHHEVFLADTDHELHVYRIQGEEPGKTIMIIGGIQGDEPSGYISADLYADLHLRRGNLIVVPRANFYSILVNRREGQTGDMNRKFRPSKSSEEKKDLDEEIVEVLKRLIQESDCLLNLHEGSGFYSPVWVSEQENPKRYGQSIIHDAESVPSGQGTGVIRLGDIARRVADSVNARIPEERYRFRPNNHDTLSEQTQHREQRISATFYALTQARIPAFGIETSKSIPDLETKIRLHRLVINAMMSEFGLVPDMPGISMEQPRLDYLLVRVNDGYPYALPHGARLRVHGGDRIVVSGIVANYSRGLVADIDGYGTKNDTNRPYQIQKETRIYVRRDAHIFAWVDLAPGKDEHDAEVAARAPETDLLPGAASSLEAKSLLVEVDGQPRQVSNREAITVSRTSRILLREVRTTNAELDAAIRVNFKGFAPRSQSNDGNDLRHPIHPATDLMPRFSENEAGKRYPILAIYQEQVVGVFWVELEG